MCGGSSALVEPRQAELILVWDREAAQREWQEGLRALETLAEKAPELRPSLVQLAKALRGLATTTDAMCGLVRAFCEVNEGLYVGEVARREVAG